MSETVRWKKTQLSLPLGQFGLRNKREVWRVRLTLAKIRTAARELLTLDEKSQKRLFEGNALLRRLVRIGVLDESRMKLDYVLGLKVEDFMERRLQTQVFKLGLAKSIHHARVLIRHRHIRYSWLHHLLLWFHLFRLLQGSKADSQCAIFYCSFGLPKAHWHGINFSTGWWASWSCEEKKPAQGQRWRKWWGRRRGGRGLTNY